MRMISLCVKNAALGLGRFYLPLLFVRENDPSLNAGALSHHCNFSLRCLGGGDAYSCTAWHGWFQWNVQHLAGVLNNGVNIFNFVKENIVNVPLLDGRLCFYVFQRRRPRGSTIKQQLRTRTHSEKPSPPSTKRNMHCKNVDQHSNLLGSQNHASRHQLRSQLLYRSQARVRVGVHIEELLPTLGEVHNLFTSLLRS